MKYKILNNISTKEYFCLFLIIICFAIMIIVPITSIRLYTEAITQNNIEERKEIYLWDNDYLVRAKKAENLKDPEEGSIKSTLIRFHRLFWNLEPYTEFIDDNHKEAVLMGDNSIKIVKRFLETKNYYKTHIAAGYHVRTKINKGEVYIDYTEKPYKFRVEGTLKVIRNKDVVLKRLVTTGTIRSDFNFGDTKKESVYENWFIQDYEVVEFNEFKILKKGEL